MLTTTQQQLLTANYTYLLSRIPYNLQRVPAAVSSVMRQAVVSLPNWDTSRSLQGYLYGAIRNGVHDYYREARPSKVVTYVPTLEGYPGPHEWEPLNRVLQKEFVAWLERLPLLEREVLHRRFYEEHTFQQIATSWGCTVNQVREQYKSALSSVRSGYFRILD